MTKTHTNISLLFASESLMAEKRIVYSCAPSQAPPSGKEEERVIPTGTVEPDQNAKKYRAILANPPKDPKEKNLLDLLEKDLEDVNEPRDMIQKSAQEMKATLREFIAKNVAFTNAQEASSALSLQRYSSEIDDAVFKIGIPNNTLYIKFKHVAEAVSQEGKKMFFEATFGEDYENNPYYMILHESIESRDKEARQMLQADVERIVAKNIFLLKQPSILGNSKIIDPFLKNPENVNINLNFYGLCLEGKSVNFLLNLKDAKGESEEVVKYPKDKLLQTTFGKDYKNNPYYQAIIETIEEEIRKGQQQEESEWE